MLRRIRLAILLVLAASTTPSLAADRDWHAVGAALGKEGTLQAGDVYKVSLPRTDLRVTLDGVALSPAFALGGWLGFKPDGEGAMVMGDFVLTRNEVDPVVAKLEESGIAVTALHNHLVGTDPVIMYLHVAGKGEPVKLAQDLHGALALTKTPLGAAQPPARPAGSLDIPSLDRIIGFSGKDNGGVLQYGIPRAERIEENGMPLPPSLGTATVINLQPTADGKAAITGDFVLTAPEVGLVAKTLRENGIAVTALHSHMLNEEPRLLFLHFWANDDAQKLARGLRAALDRMNVAKG